MKKQVPRWVLILGLVVALSPLVGTGESRVSWVFDLSGQGKFFDLPFPTELRREASGTIKMDDFPKLLGLEMVARTKEAVSRGYGFSTATTIYFRFTGPVNEKNFPSPAESMKPSSPLFLMDIDPASPERGRRFPVIATFYPRGPDYFTGVHYLLAFMPKPGFVLRENTLYAAGVMRSLGEGKNAGQPLGRNETLTALIAGKEPGGELGKRAQEVYGPALKSLSELGVAVEELAALTVFRTGDPAQRMISLFEGAKEIQVQLDSPLKKTREYDLYTVLQGALLMPQFQDGKPAYGHGKGGRLQFNAAGKPVVQRRERVPFALTIPKGKMPAQGFPLMIYIHGTGGNSTQFIDRGPEPDTGHDESETGMIRSMMHQPGAGAPPGSGPAMVLAHRGIAAAGAAQPLSGERGGLDSQLYFYNFPSPEALRDNLLQAAAEAAIFLRFLTQLELDPAFCPGTDTGGGKVRFNPELVFGMGQSLGSLILGPWGGVETELKVLIPSGNGAYWPLFMAEGNALGMKSLRRSNKTLSAVTKLDLFHPLICLMGTVLAPADPFVYQPRYWKEPLPGRKPKNVWASFGLIDHYFYPVSQNAAIVAMGLDLAGTPGEPSILPELELAGLKRLDYPVSGNKQTPAGAITAVALQYPMVRPLDGHHINFQRNDTKYQYGCFLESYIKTGVPVLYAPKDQWDAPCGP